MKRHLYTVSAGVLLGLAGCSGNNSSSPTPTSETPAPPLVPTPGGPANLSPGSPNKPTEPRIEKGTPEDRKLLATVSAQVLEHCPKVSNQEWPPQFVIDGDDVRASASLQKAEHKLYPVITVTADLMAKVVEGDEHRLALILAHELGHHLAGHVLNERVSPGILNSAISRTNEFEADRIGAELMLKAQFSLRRGLVVFDRLEELGYTNWTFKSTGDEHPKWDDRRAAIDKERVKLWQVMGEFTNGVEWLAANKYPAAAICFESVVSEFPKSFESWANLGFARLMHYIDKLDDEDNFHFQNGQIVTAGFFKREKSTVRGEDVDLWKSAIAALQRAEELQRGQPAVLTNLGIAHLVTPQRLGMDAEAAHGFLFKAKAAAKDPEALSLAIANLAVAEMAKGEVKNARILLKNLVKDTGKLDTEVAIAIKYTQALALAESKTNEDRQSAFKLFEEYLGSASPLSRWWAAAYQQYAALAKELALEAKKPDELKRGNRPHLQLVTGINLKNGKTVSIGDTTKSLLELAGPGRASKAIPNTNAQRIRYESEGLEFLVDERVLAIMVVGSEANPIAIRGAEVSTINAGELRVGMPETALVALLGQTVQRPEILTPNVRYLYYRAQGLAVRVAAGKVVELMVVQLPQA